MRCIINGEAREFSAPPTVAEMIESLGVAGKKIAVEINGGIIPRGRIAEQQVRDGDIVEIVVAVGGG